MQKFRNVLSRWERKELSAMEAGELLGWSERQFRRYRRRYEDDGLARGGRSPARQGVDASGAGGQAGVDAGGIPHASPGVERKIENQTVAAAPAEPETSRSDLSPDRMAPDVFASYLLEVDRCLRRGQAPPE
jgi:hypothetical protein